MLQNIRVLKTCSFLVSMECCVYDVDLIFHEKKNHQYKHSRVAFTYTAFCESIIVQFIHFVQWIVSHLYTDLFSSFFVNCLFKIFLLFIDLENILPCLSMVIRVVLRVLIVILISL